MITKYNRLTLITDAVGKNADGRIMALWKCDCGREVEIARCRVIAGSPKSCGCFAVERNRESAVRHGGRNTPEYSSWIAMRRRCLNPADKDYPRYGGRGITICPQWDDFAVFLADLGPRPAGMTLDRVDTQRGYEPDNVRWATAKVQGRNRRKTFIWHIKGRTFGSITEAATAFAVSEHTVSRWVNGAFDKRRNQHVKPRPDCTVEERYS